MNKNILGTYENGNCKVTILKDGTKIRHTDDDEFLPEKPESMDLKITNRCTIMKPVAVYDEEGKVIRFDEIPTNCPMCHEMSGPKGNHGDIMNLKFIDTLAPYTELAIGGGNVLEHPQFVPFLEKCKERNLICNATFNEYHFLKEIKLIKSLARKKLLYGIGVSLTPAVGHAEEVLEAAKGLKNVVIHVINGVHSIEVIKELYDRNVTMLILGYKTFGRGKAYYANLSPIIEEIKGGLKDELKHLIPHFRAVSFDNLAIEQLDVKSLMSPEQWNEFYMGDEGSFTMYVDAVKCEYGESSISTERFPLEDDIVPMFSNIRQLTGHKVYKKD